MALHRWSLVNAHAEDCGKDITVKASDVTGVPTGWSVRKRTLHTGLSQGVAVVEIDNGLMTSVIIPTRGMGIWRLTTGNCELCWKSPVRGPVHPAFVPIAESSGLGWLSGFDELMCRCGLENNGAPDFDERGHLLFPLHGRIANRPAHEVELEIDDRAGTISLHGVVEESRFHYQKLRMHTTFTTQLGSSQIAWHDEVENFGGSVAGMQMLYHINIGQPQLDAGSRIVAPLAWVSPGNADTVAMGIENWDRYSAPDARFRQQVYQLGLLPDDRGNSSVLLRNAAGDSGVQVSCNAGQLPCFSLWRNLVPEADGYVTGLEPATNFPNPRTSEAKHGRVVKLQPGEKWQADVALDWLVTSAEVARLERQIAERQGSRAPTLHNEIFYERAG